MSKFLRKIFYSFMHTNTIYFYYFKSFIISDQEFVLIPNQFQTIRVNCTLFQFDYTMQ